MKQYIWDSLQNNKEEKIDGDMNKIRLAINHSLQELNSKKGFYF